MGILKNRMVEVWYKHKIIDENQHAFLRGKSTAQPIYLRKFILADAVHKNKFVGLTDIDLARAYDQTERWVKEMSFRRFGVPEPLIEYFGLLDTGNKNYVLTAYGPGREFEALMGAYAQGDDLSPLGWVCTMDWKLGVCDTGAPDPYVVRNNDDDVVSKNTLACWTLEIRTTYSRHMDRAESLKRSWVHMHKVTICPHLDGCVRWTGN